jgi:hypothetical protein
MSSGTNANRRKTAIAPAAIAAGTTVPPNGALPGSTWVRSSTPNSTSASM